MLNKVCRLDYTIVLDSGLHIGGSSDSFDIGGPDSTVIRNPMNNQPYIPGSSIKGKLKSMLKMKDGQIDGTEIKLTDKNQIALFSPVDGKDATDYIQISRGIFRDAVLANGEELEKYLGVGKFTEIKGENTINPLKSKAANPRFIERVPAGAKFDGSIILQIFDHDNEEALKKNLLDAMKMLENNYLGGSGTRGYGRLHFENELKFITVFEED